ncbi:MAG: hypothetical protein R3Y21_00965 [Mycoplasmatota bacterium]
MDREQLIQLIETIKIDKDKFWILSSSALVLRKLYDKANDLDIAVTREGLEQLKKQYDLLEKENGWFKVNDKIECCVDEYEDYKVEKTKEYNLESLEKYFEYLKSSKREKDIIKYKIVKEELLKRNIIINDAYNEKV